MNDYGRNQGLWQWKIMEYILYGMVFLIPMYVGTGHWFPFSAPKALLIYLGTFLMTIMYFWGVLKNRNNEVVVTPLHWAVLVFLGTVTIASLVGIDSHNSFFGVWSQSVGVVLLYCVGILAVLVGFLVRKKKEIVPRLFVAAFISGVIVSVIAYVGKAIVPLSRVGSTLGNSSFAGVYFLFIFCFGIGLTIWYKEKWKKFFVGIGMLIIGLNPVLFNHDLFLGSVSFGQALRNPLLVIGQANGAVLGIVAAVLIGASLGAIRAHKRYIKIIGGVLFTMIVVGSFAIGILVTNPQSRIHQKIVEEKSGNRFLFWDIANSGFNEHPWLGNGFNNYIYTYQTHFKHDFYKKGSYVEPWTNQPHNIIWEYLSTTGIIGTLSFLGFILTMVVSLYGYSNNKDEKTYIFNTVLLGAIFGYLVQNLFGFDIPVSYLFLFIIAGIAMGYSSKYWTINILSNSTSRKIIGMVGIVCGFVGIIFFVIAPWKESRMWRKETSSYHMQDGFGMMEQVQGRSLFGGVADSAFFMDVFFNKYQNGMIANYQKTHNIEPFVSAEHFLESEIKKQPNNLRTYLVLVNIMTLHSVLIGNKDRALLDTAAVYTQKARVLSPTRVEPYILATNLAIINNDINKARGLIRAGIATAPELLETYSLAEKMIIQYPDADFERYVHSMKKRWIK